MSLLHRPSVLSLEKLRVELMSGEPIIDDVSLQVRRGEILGIVGESGSGKTTSALSLFGYAGPGARIISGHVCLAGETFDLPGDLRSVRGRLVSYVPQNPGSALNPSLRVGDAINDVLTAHRARTAGHSAEGLLGKVNLPASRPFARRFPHQLSGGQQQRVCVALALACYPPIVVLDEPTTGLDVVTQARILRELLRLRDDEGVSLIYVTHDLAVVAQIADRIAVMYAGRIVEEGSSDEVLRRPRHPYTRGLISSIPDHRQLRTLEPMAGIAPGVGDRPSGCSFRPRCSQSVPRCEAEMPAEETVAEAGTVRCFEWRQTPPVAMVPLTLSEENSQPATPIVLRVEHLRAEHRSHGETLTVADDVSFDVRRGGCVALVGESGSGKTTIARTIAGLHPIAGGRILLDDEPLASLAARRTAQQRRRLQLVFQNPSEALNPRHTTGSAIGRAVKFFRDLSGKELTAEVGRLLECVRLPAGLSEHYPTELSGGERQRVAIARALAADPQLILCDEITSALDVSVQAAVLQLLADLRRDLGTSLVFITHDLGVVASVADDVLILEGGEVVEAGPVAQVLTAPSHPSTEQLLVSAPSLSAAAAAWDAC